MSRAPMRIAIATDAHHASLADLLCELHAHHNGGRTVARAAVLAHLKDNLLAADSPLRLVVAEDAQGCVAGFAAIMLLYSLVDPMPASRRQCHMKELYVSASARGAGIGRALMAWIAGYATGEGCHRIDWHVQASNAAGRRFYERLGAQVVGDRMSYRLAGPALDALASPQRCAAAPA
jgi:ribosomal protein S18 acetylase RimI-like enzyme